MPKLKNRPCEQFTPERWAIVKAVLAGEDPAGVSLALAARKVGITPATIRHWAKRSRNPHPGDHPLLAEVAPFFEEAVEMQAGLYEDNLHRMAMQGDRAATLKLLAVRDERYSDKPRKEETVEIDSREIYQRLLAARTMAEIEAERDAEAKAESRRSSGT